MAYEAKWLIEGHVLLNRHVGEITSDDVINIIQESYVLVENSDHTFHLLVDLSEFTALGAGLGKIPDIIDKTNQLFKHPQLGITVASGTNNRMIKFLGSITTQMSNLELHFVPNHTEAIQLLIRLAPDIASQLEKLMNE